MKRIHFDPTTLGDQKGVWWQNWEAKANAATQEIVACADQGKELDFKENIWKELKEWLLEHVFHGCCAYCESRITHICWGDADHYRPKGRVRVFHKGVKTIVIDGNTPHRGYYWLAYDWRNLLPSCQRCNSEGKSDLFPIDGTRVTDHKVKDHMDFLKVHKIEQAQLLHPYFDQPRDHLAFGAKGAISWKTERGRSTIQICKLNREELRIQRQRLQEDAWRKFWFEQAQTKGKKFAHYESICEGEVEHSAACLDHIDREFAKINQDMSVIKAKTQ